MLRGEKIVFTGKLDTLSRKQAQDLVSALGGKPQAAVTKDTPITIIEVQSRPAVAAVGYS